MRRYTVKENHIGSAVSKILRYRQTHILEILLLYYKDSGYAPQRPLVALEMFLK